MVVSVEQLTALKADLVELVKTSKAGPILVRLAWHDSGTFDKNIEEWPTCGGANGSIKWALELAHGANAGLAKARDLVEDLKLKKYPEVSYADLFQMASAVAIEVMGGPVMPIKYGRVDVPSEVNVPKEGRLPGYNPENPEQHLKDVFYRMGFNDQEIVVLSGAHTVGRAFKDRSGAGRESTKYTGEEGGDSWTVNYRTFDNEYFKHVLNPTDEELLMLPTDRVLGTSDAFKPYVEKYAASQEAFFVDYCEAHVKLSELGVRWAEGAPVTL